MTREEFIQVLDDAGYSYEMEGDKIVITEDGDVRLKSLQTLPPGVVFKNGGYVVLGSLETIPPDVVFKNTKNVILNNLKTIHRGVEFMNEGKVFLSTFKLLRIHPGVEFNNGLGVYFTSSSNSSFYNLWDGNIEGIDSKRLLNFMISKGMFI